MKLVNLEPIDQEVYMSELVQKYSDMVLRLAFTYLQHIADAQDICQEVFIKCLKANKSFHDAEHEKAWILRVTINACKDMIRSPWRKRVSINEAVALIKENESREVVEFVLKLPKKYRMVIHLYYYENYRTTEIAELLNRKESTIRTQLKRARELLRTQMIGGFDDGEV